MTESEGKDVFGAPEYPKPLAAHVNALCMLREVGSSSTKISSTKMYTDTCSFKFSMHQ